MTLEELLESMAFPSDMLLVTSDGKRLNLHRAVLASSSGIFRKLFEDFPSDQEFSVPEPAELVESALSHVYDDSDPPPMTLDSVRDLVPFFGKYDVRKGLRAYDTFLAASAELDSVCATMLDTANLPEWIVLADQHKLTSFLDKCVSYAAEHLEEMDATETWLLQLLPATLTSLVRT